MHRLAVFVDGFNLYYSIRELNVKWLNIASLADDICACDQKVTSFHYFTAMVDGKGDPGRPIRQMAYLRALQTDPRVSIYRGSFIHKTVHRPIERLCIVGNELVLPELSVVLPRGKHDVVCTRGTKRQLPIYDTWDSVETPLQSVFAHVKTREEKGSDVNLACQLLNRAWKNEFDTAVVISNDSDLCEPIRIVREELGKNVSIWHITTQRSRTATTSLRRVASSVFHVRPSVLQRHQFTDRIQLPNDRFIYKPNGW